MVGAPDALQQARGALGGPDIDHQIDVPPIDAEIERGRAHDRAQLAARHGGLDLAALRDVERSVMQRDREAVLVDAPQLLKDPLRLAARIDEHQRGAMPPDVGVDLAERVLRRMSGPRQPLGGVEHGDVGRRAAVGHHQVGQRFAIRRLRHQEPAQIVGRGHGRGQTDARECRRQPKEPRQPKREEIAPLGGH